MTRRTQQSCLGRPAALLLAVASCAHASAPPPLAAPAPSAPARPATLTGTAVYEDGTPIRHGMISATDLATGAPVDVFATDETGGYRAALAPGNYALATAADDGFGWVERQVVPAADVRLTLSRSCQPLEGVVERVAGSVRVNLERQSLSTGDTFVTAVHLDGKFGFCLPKGQYRAFLSGDALSTSIKFDLPATAVLHIPAVAARDVQQPAAKVAPVDATLRTLVGDVIASGADFVGLGEATHGTAEFFTARGELTLALIRAAEVRLMLFEFDAIAAAALDYYVNGGDVDPAKAVADLGFWITDTYEFLHFLEQLRAYNATTSDKVHLWGIDLQNTSHPVDVLLAAAGELSIAPDDQAILKTLVKRGKGVLDLSVTQRAGVDALLARLATPRGHSKHDLLVAVAARSLETQLGYWKGEMGTWLSKRRDLGMADLARFLLAQSGSRRVCLWAHDAHISKQPSEFALGHHLATTHRYYAVGFYIYQGSARAVDAEGKIGVIPHPVPPAPPYTVENAISTAAGAPDIAWLALHSAPPALRRWLATPRFVRELKAVYMGEESTMTLRDTLAAFDAIAVIRTGHDSSPTPTGVRLFKH